MFFLKSLFHIKKNTDIQVKYAILGNQKTYIVFGKTVTFHFHSSDYIASNSNIMSQGLVMSCLVSSSNNFHIILMFVTWLTSHVKKTLTYPVCERAVLLGATHFEIINNLTCKRLHNHSSTRVNFFLLYQCALQISSYEFFIDKTSFLFVNTRSSNKPNSF